MINLFWPIIIVVAANTIYNISAKLTPSEVHPLASLSITYFTAALLSILLFFITSENKNVITEIQKSNWTAVVLGLSIVALEFGYIYIYRVGWNVSTGSLVANISLACVLLIVGVFIYKENISFHQILGMVLCAVGLLLVTK
ncbi:EamA family transporter [Clostridium sp. PL3]|uniref:EamA family transporter n=1 Tax=Clostridium thailandense TaxID=2794346 RepID=A0A949TP09_9CLOT|nr:EamA family transporter [Clostridium thailandense]MBV7272772.1 EamA family transporter [Clostridium thailandense]